MKVEGRLALQSGQPVNPVHEALGPFDELLRDRPTPAKLAGMDYDPFAGLYEQQYASYRDDLHFYAGLAEQVGAGSERGGRVLEVGAGTGRVSHHLARRGVRVLGLEPSAEMLARARSISAQAAPGSVVPEFVQGDAAGFGSSERFALVIAPFNALMHLYTPAEQLAALQNLRAHLAPGGRFAFDLYVPRFSGMNVLRHEGETFFGPGGERRDLFFLQRHDPAQQRLTTEYFADTTRPGGELRREHFTLTQRYYTRFEMEWLLRCAGFAPPRVSGSFQGGPVTEASEVMVFQTGAVGS